MATDGGPGGRYEATYLVVPPLFWLRCSLHVGRSPRREWWLASFVDEPLARKALAPPDATVERGAVAGAEWELEVTPLARPFDPVHPLLRPLARTRLFLPQPAAAVTGFVHIDGKRHELRDAPAGVGRVSGSRHADRWGWAHATLPGGRWVELLAAKVPRLPQVASFATDSHRRSALRAAATVTPTELEIGPYRVEVAASDLVGVTYEDPDGARVYCYHSERARLTGAGVDAPAAFEFGTREPLREPPPAF